MRLLRQAPGCICAKGFSYKNPYAASRAGDMDIATLQVDWEVNAMRVNVWNSRPTTGGILPLAGECAKPWSVAGFCAGFVTWLVIHPVAKAMWEKDHLGGGRYVTKYDGCYDGYYNECERWVDAQWTSSGSDWAWHVLMFFVFAGLVVEVIYAFARKLKGAEKDLVEVYRSTLHPVDEESKGGKQGKRQPSERRRQTLWLIDVPLMGAAWGAAIGAVFVGLIWFLFWFVIGIRDMSFGSLLLGVGLGAWLITVVRTTYWAILADERAYTEAGYQSRLDD